MIESADKFFFAQDDVDSGYLNVDAHKIFYFLNSLQWNLVNITNSLVHLTLLFMIISSFVVQGLFESTCQATCNVVWEANTLIGYSCKIYKIHNPN